MAHDYTAGRLKLGWADTAFYQSILGAGIISCGVMCGPLIRLLGARGNTSAGNVVTLYDPTFRRTVWRLYGGVKVS